MSKTVISKLENGLTVITVRQSAMSAMIGVFTNVGARSETEKQNGISHFLEHLIFKGTETRSAKDIALQIEQLGADINAFTGREMTGYFVNGLTEHIVPALDILADVIQHSVFDAEEIEREKNVVVQEINCDLDDIEAVAMDLLSATAYPNHAMGRPILGNEELVRSFSAEMLRNYMNSHYNTYNMVVIGVGDIDHDNFVKKVKKRFGKLPTSERIVPSEAVYVGGFAQKVDLTYEQAHIGIAFPAPGEENSREYDFLASVLGGGMASPLFQELREKRGLCYDVGASLIPNKDHSLFVLHGATSPDNVVNFVPALCLELRNIVENGIHASDWERTVNRFLRAIEIENENRMKSGIRAITDLFTLNHIRSRKEIIAGIKEMTQEKVIAAARNILTLNQQATIVIAGNAPEIDYSVLVYKTLSS